MAISYKYTFVLFNFADFIVIFDLIVKILFIPFYFICLLKCFLYL